MSFETFVLGTGGMMPLPNRYLTSVLMRREGYLFLFDCGEGTQISLRNLNLKWKKISAVFVSHTHADHITGIPGLLMLSAQVDRDEPLYIIGPPKIKEYIETSRRVLDMYINYEIIVKEIENPSVPGEVFRGDDFSVYSFPLNHSKVCVGYKLVEDPRPGIFDPVAAEAAAVPRGPLWARLQQGETVTNSRGEPVEPSAVMGPPRRGCRFSFVTDTAYLPSIASEVSGSDLFICEGMFTADLADSAAEKKHLTSVQAARIAAEAGDIGQMGLIHYSPRYTHRDLQQLLTEAKEVFPRTFLTKDGMSLSVKNQD